MSALREMTAEQIAKSEGVTVDAVRARWNDLRETMPELFAGSFSRNIPLSDAQETALRSAKSSAKKPVRKSVSVARKDVPTVAENATVVQEEKAAAETPKSASADWMLDFINVSEILAAFVGFCLLFDWVGIAPGIICAAFYGHSMAVMKRPGAWESAMLAKFVCFILAAVFGWVHFQTFTWALNEYRPDIDAPFFVSLCGAVLLSGISLMALYQSRNVKTDNQ